MSDEPIGGVYEPVVEPGQALPQEPEPQPKYVTVEDLDAFSEKLFRKFQSLTDKSESRIKKELEDYRQKLNERADNLRKAGITVTDEQIKRAQDDYAQQLLAQGFDDELPAQAGLPRPDPATVKKVNLELAKLQAQYEYIPDESDPEFRGMNWSNPDPEAFLADYKTRFARLGNRLGKTAPVSQPEEPPVPGARVAVTGQGVAGGLEELTNELARLQNIVNPTRAQETRRKELAAKILTLVPKR